MSLVMSMNRKRITWRLRCSTRPIPLVCPGNAPGGGTPGLDGECAACRAKRLGLQRRAATESALAEVPPVVHEVLQSSGQPLDPGTRAFFEPRLGHDFSRVRVHADPSAARSASAVSAEAYTVGPHVVFRAGTYAPNTRSGRWLLAHELAHVVQQDRGKHAPPAALQDSALEQAADQAAESLAKGIDHVSVEGASTVGLARKPRTTDEYTKIFYANRKWQRELNPEKSHSSDHWPYDPGLHELWWSHSPDDEPRKGERKMKDFIDAVWKF